MGLNGEDQGLLTQDEQALLKRVERSRIWRLLRDALCQDRELLFRSQPTTTETMWRTWGAIEYIGKLLHEGPSLVLWYQRFVDAQEDVKLRERAQTRMTAERTFDPDEEEKPRFDM